MVHSLEPERQCIFGRTFIALRPNQQDLNGNLVTTSMASENRDSKT